HDQSIIRGMLLGGPLGIEGLNIKKVYNDGRAAMEAMEPRLLKLIYHGLTVEQILNYDPKLANEGTAWGEFIKKRPPFISKTWDRFIKAKEARERWLSRSWEPT